MYKFVNGVKYKKCPHCGEYKPLNEYHTNSNGHKSWCISCSNTYAREYAKAKKQENKPIVRIHEVSNNVFCQSKLYSTKELKEWYKQLLNDKSGKRYIITKL